MSKGGTEKDHNSVNRVALGLGVELKGYWSEDGYS